MNGVEPLSGPSAEPRSGGPARQLIILLHGRGANGNDLLGLAPPFSELLPDARFAAPNAPFVCEQSFGGFEWFHLEDRQPRSFLDGARAAGPQLDAFIDQELAASGLGVDKLALVGFSQGTMMSLFVGLRRAGAEELSHEITARPPVSLITGDADELIPPEALPEAAKALKAAGVPVEAHVRPGLGHGIDQEGVEIGRRFVARNLGIKLTS